MFYLFYIFIWIITWLPLRVLYLISDCIYPVIYYLARYRREVVRKNLVRSFPEKSIDEIKKIERKFYRYFCDLFIETIYQIHMTEDEMCKRFDIGNLDLILDQYKAGKSVMIMTAHYGNWEWAASIAMYVPNDKPVYSIYKKLKSKSFDTFMDSLRLKFGGGNIETQSLLRTMVKFRSEGKVSSFGMIADQTPAWRYIRYWTKFLNQDTPVLTGTEELARKFDYPVVFMHVDRVKRGYYKCNYSTVSLHPKQTKDFEITEKYMQILEDKIKSEPAFWLWSHNRWKHTKPAE